MTRTHRNSKTRQNHSASQVRKARTKRRGSQAISRLVRVPNNPRNNMGRKHYLFRRRQSRSAARSIMAPNDEGHADNEAAEFEQSTVSLSSSGRNNPNLFSNASSADMHAIQMQQMQLLKQLGSAMQKLSNAVDANTSAIQDMQHQQKNGQQRHYEFRPSKNNNNNNANASIHSRTSPTNVTKHSDAMCNNETTQQRTFDIFIPSPSDQRSDSCSSSSSSSGISDPDEGLERKKTRLDGLEVYAVVSAVSCGTLVAVFDCYHPGDLFDLFSAGRWLELCLSLLFSACGSLGIVCGLHCIFVFSLITMYARTAIGMERDDALEIFFSGTGLQRYHGFKTFVASLYCLALCLLIVIGSKLSSNPYIHLFALMISAKLMHYVYRDTQDIMSKATVIFAAPPAPLSPPMSLTSDESTMAMKAEECVHPVVASASESSLLRKDDKGHADGSKNDLPPDDATKSQSATEASSSKKEDTHTGKQKKSRRRRSSLGLSAAEHIAMEEEKCGTTCAGQTAKRASAMTLSATDLIGANAGISSSSMAISRYQKQKELRTTSDATVVEKSDLGDGNDGNEAVLGETDIAGPSVDSAGTCSRSHDIHNLVQQKNFRMAWKAAAQKAVTLPANACNDEGINQDRGEEDSGNSSVADSSDDSADAKRLAKLLSCKESGWQQQAWLAAVKAAHQHQKHHHHHGQCHNSTAGKRHSTAMTQSALDHINMDATGAGTMHLFGGIKGRRASGNSSRAA